MAEPVQDCSDFHRLLAVRFPEIISEIDEVEQGLLHLEMAALARATSRSIEIGDLPQVHKHIGFVDELLLNGGSDIQNAVYVSYLENVFIGSDDPRYLRARTMLTNGLERALSELEEHWNTIAKTKRGTALDP
jgi:hypothetical protein